MYELALFMSLLGFGVGTVSRLPYVWYSVVKIRFKHEECESMIAHVF